jgi:adenosylcobalamin phosphodiesterase
VSSLLKPTDQISQFADLKAAFPFRLGTTSYILPDEIEPNVLHLAPIVDDIELVLFESAEYSNLPSPERVSHLADLAAEHNLSYTVHLPLDARLGISSPEKRKVEIAKCQQVIERMLPAKPLAWILHLDPRRPGPEPAENIADWLEALEQSLGEILSLIKAEDLCLENLHYPFGLLEPLIEKHQLSVCIDVGHLLKEGLSVQDHFQYWSQRCRVVHLHGIRNDHDHRDIAALPRPVIEAALSSLSSGDSEKKVLTLEIFNPQDLQTSLVTLASFRKMNS